MNYSFSLAAAWVILASSAANAFTTNPIHRGMVKPIDSRVSLSAETPNKPIAITITDSSEFNGYPFKNVDATLVYPQTLVYPPNIPSKILESVQRAKNVKEADKNLRDAIKDRAFLFNGEEYIKFNFNLTSIEGNIRSIKARRGLDDYPFSRVDACLVFPERIKENTAFFFCENKFAEYDLQSLSNGKVNGIKLISDAFPGFPFPKVDAVISLEDRALFVYENKYAVWDFGLESFVEKNKKIVDLFEGLPFTSPVDATLTLPDDNGKLTVYLFSGDTYVKYVDWEFQGDTDTSDSASDMDEDPKAKTNFRFDKNSTEHDKQLSTKTKADYRPLKNAAVLKEQTRADSVVVEGDFQLLEYRGKKVEEVWEEDDVTGAIIKPLYPGDEGFWEQFKEVVDVQNLRRNNDKDKDKKILKRGDGKDMLSKYSNWPELWYNRGKSKLNPWGENNPDKELTLEKVAKSVAGEFSNYHQQVLLKDLAGKGVKLSADIGLRFRSDKDFIGMEVRMGAINAWSLEAVGPVNFMLKWYYGVPRPEEVAWHIKCEDLTVADGVPPGVFELIRKMTFANQFEFTAYAKGSPTHPSFPAMHSAGSTCSLWIPTLYELTPDQYLETLRTDHSVAFARTVAGVHYPQDNIAGLNIGQRIIREKLPKFLAENYGYDEKAVKNKVEALSFDWNDVKFTKDGCTIKGVKHAKFLKDALGEE